MGMITDILKEIPLSALLKEKLTEAEKRYENLETENTALRAENEELKAKLNSFNNLRKEPTDYSEEDCLSILDFTSLVRSG